MMRPHITYQPRSAGRRSHGGVGYMRRPAAGGGLLTLQQLLSLSPATPTGTQVQIQAMRVRFSYSDISLGEIEVDEFWSYRGITNDRPYWRRFGLPDDTATWTLYFTGSAWRCQGDGGSAFTVPDTAASPELIAQASWEADGNGIAKPLLTLNPVVELQPPDDTVVGMGVYAGSCWWLMPQNGWTGSPERPFYYRLGGASTDPDDAEDLACWTNWYISDFETGTLYNSPGDTSDTPDQVSSWDIGVSASSPKPVIVPYTNDDLASGLVVAGTSSAPEILDSYYNTGEVAGSHYLYRGVNGAPDLYDRAADGVPWDWAGDHFRGTVPSPFPWGSEWAESAANGSITVTKSRPAGLKNWAPVA